MRWEWFPNSGKGARNGRLETAFEASANTHRGTQAPRPSTTQGTPSRATGRPRSSASAAAGVTVRSAIDCLIARVAIERELILLHDDRDLENVARVIPELMLA